LATQDRSNYIGNVFELKVAAEDLASRGLKEINHYEGGKKGIDFILNDGTIVEVKNRQMIDQSVYEQFQRFVGISYEEGVPIAVDARYPNSRMEYVFRSPRNEVAENNLKSIAEDANSLNKLSDNNLQYFKENIRWLNLDDFPPAGS